jgi:type VI secretion system secreted protein Hcp
MRNVNRLLAAAAVIIFVSATSANAAHNIIVSAKGQKQGNFKGESARQAYQDKMEASAFVLEITSPRDAASGQASGKRQFKPLLITKQVGAASPQFLQALATNEVLQTVTLDFLKTNQNGEEYVYYTIKLTNATVASVRQYTPGTGAGGAAGGSKHAAAHDAPQMEDISFSFQKIEIENTDGKTLFVDDWTAGK